MTADELNAKLQAAELQSELLSDQLRSLKVDLAKSTPAFETETLKEQNSQLRAELGKAPGPPEAARLDALVAKLAALATP